MRIKDIMYCALRSTPPSIFLTHLPSLLPPYQHINSFYCRHTNPSLPLSPPTPSPKEINVPPPNLLSPFFSAIFTHSHFFYLFLPNKCKLPDKGELDKPNIDMRLKDAPCTYFKWKRCFDTCATERFSDLRTKPHITILSGVREADKIQRKMYTVLSPPTPPPPPSSSPPQLIK